MSYQPNIPQATDRIADSQVDLLTNFQQLNNVYGADHYAYNDGTANATKHKHVTLPDQLTPDVRPTPGASNLAIFSKTENSITTPYYRRDASTTDIPVSPIKAYIAFNGNGGVTNIGTPFNCTASRTAAGQYVITVSNNVITDANFLVLVTGTKVGGGAFNAIFTYTTTYSAPNAIANVFSVKPDSSGFIDSNPISVCILKNA